jgi:hypothetical protein
MSSCLELQQKGMVEAFQLEPQHVGEATESLIGFFRTLEKIEHRLMREGHIDVNEQYV